MATTITKSIDAEAIKRTHDMRDIVEAELGQPARGRAQPQWCCPFHQERGPSFTVYEDHAFCFGCHWTGDAIKFIRERRGLSYVEACRLLDATLTGARQFKEPRLAEREAREGYLPSVMPEAPPLEWQEKALALIAECDACLWDKSDPNSVDVLRYLAGRGLNEDTLQAHRVGYNSVERDLKQIKLWLPQGITIPYWHERANILYGINVRLTAAQRARLRSGDAKYMTATGSKRAPLGLDTIGGKSHVFVLEGEFDYMLTLQTLRALGKKAAHAGALTMGSATSQDIEAWLLLNRELLDPVRYLIATDSDPTGQNAARKWLEKTGRARVWKPPSPCKDITELWQKHGYEGVRWWVLEGLQHHHVP